METSLTTRVLFARHVMLPLTATGALVALWLTPASAIGCLNRGLLALAVVFASLITGIVVGLIGVKARMQGEPHALWYGLTTLVLVIPALLILGPLG